MTTSSLHQIVMRRVRTIHALKAASSGAVLSGFIFTAALYRIGREVWVARVWENMPELLNFGAEARFFAYAFTHTQLSVQALLIVSIFAFVWFLREFARVLSVSVLRMA